MVDMPGYGFAQAPKAKVEQWTRLVRDYLRGRATLVRVFLLLDARHGLKPPDLTVMAADGRGGRFLSGRSHQGRQDQAGRAWRVTQKTAAALRKHAAAYPAMLATSSQTGAGVAELRAEIARLAKG